MLIPRSEYDKLLAYQENISEKQIMKETSDHETTERKTESKDHFDNQHQQEAKTDQNIPSSPESKPEFQSVENAKKRKRATTTTIQSGGKLKNRRFVRQTFSEFFKQKEPIKKWVSYKM